MMDPWAAEERVRCVTELAAFKQGRRCFYDDGAGLQDVSEESIARLEKWIAFLDSVIEGQGVQDA